MTVVSHKAHSWSLNTLRLRRKTHVYRRRHTWRSRPGRDHSASNGSNIKGLCAHGNEERASCDA